VATETLILPDMAALPAVRRAVAAANLPTSVEVLVEPAQDYPGQQLAVDLYAPSAADLAGPLPC
jgi:hypothetical protein